MSSSAPPQARKALIDLQRLLLPPALPAVGCTEAAVHYRALNDDFRVGGDWYDLIDRPDDRVVVIVGDVVGHGVTQISAMGQLRAGSNALGRTLASPGEILAAVDPFAADVPGGEFASMAILMLDGTTTGQVALAGHPPPVIVRASGGWSLIEAGRGPLLTIPAERSTGSFTYEVDDVILMYTDGLLGTEDPTARLAAVAEFVRPRLEEPCRDIARAIIDEFGADADDDVVVIALRPRNHRAPGFRLRPQAPPDVVFE